MAASLKPSSGAWSFVHCYFDRLPDTLACAAVSAAFWPIVSTFADGDWQIAPKGLNTLMQGGAAAWCSDTASNELFECEFSFSDPAAARSILKSLPAPRGGAEPSGFFIPCELLLARLRLVAAKVQSLRVGDVLVGGALHALSVSTPSHCRPLHALLRVGTTRQKIAEVKLDSGRWWVVALTTQTLMEPPMEDDKLFLDETDEDATDPRQQDATHNWNAAELKIGVDVVACRTAMTVAAVQALRPGSALELPHGLDDCAVEIRVGGRRYASGMLIALDGRLAVQITSINSALPAHNPGSTPSDT